MASLMLRGVTRSLGSHGLTAKAQSFNDYRIDFVTCRNSFNLDYQTPDYIELQHINRYFYRIIGWLR